MIALVLQVVWVQAAIAQLTLSSEEATKNFLAVALGRFDSPSEDFVVKWTEAIKFGIAGEGTNLVRPKLTAHIAHLRYLTNHRIELVDVEDANFVVLRIGTLSPESRARYAVIAGRFFPDDATLQSHLEAADRTGCAASIRFRKEGTSGTHAIIFAAKRGAILNSICMVYGTLLGLGLRNRPVSGTYTMLAHPLRHYELTLQDMMFLRTLYDPRIKVGMTRSVLEPVARKVLSEFHLDR